MTRTLFTLLLLAVAAVVPCRAATLEVLVSQDPGTFLFIPNDGTIMTGDTVTWSGLLGGKSHNVVQAANGSIMTPLAGGFNSGGSDTLERTFYGPGTYYYICSPHVSFGMRGQFSVVAGPQGFKSSFE
jgi:plastocyanin